MKTTWSIPVHKIQPMTVLFISRAALADTSAAMAGVRYARGQARASGGECACARQCEGVRGVVRVGRVARMRMCVVCRCRRV